MQWNYQKIEYFLKVAETLNFSRAAKELYISPQSLNKQIILLEKELGEPLFQRTTRKVELTTLGKHMQQEFSPAFLQFAKAADGMESYLQRRKRRVRIAFFQAISKKEVINPITNYLRGCERGLQVELLAGEIDEVIQWLYQGKCDLVITNVHQFEVWKDVEMIPFIKTPAKITVSLYHPWVVKEEITVEDMENMPLLLLERKKELEQDSFYRKIQPKEREYAPNFNTLLATVGMGNCYAVIPKIFESMNQMGLQYLELPKEFEFFYEMVAVYRKDSHMEELFESLRSFAEEGSIQIT